MGIVYKATHVFLKSTHAVKVILPDLVGNDPMLGTRFRQEAMVAASIVHRNIVRVTDFGMAKGAMPYLIMEFLQGKSLYDFLQQHGKLSVKLALEIMEPITAGVGAAHRQTIIHRDLKPLNIFIQEGLPLDEGIKVLDFGLAKIKSEDLLGSFVQARTTNLMGSPHYMAPEQWSEGAPDARADIYSLAVILYEMLAGEPPFNAQSMPEIMKKHLMDRPTPFSQRGVRVSPGIEAAICHALEKDPQMRPASAEAFMTELREALGAEDDGGATGFEKTLASVANYETAETITGQFAESSMTHEDLSLLETQRKAESEAERLLRELEEAQSRAEDARRRVEEAARKRLEEEEARKRAEAEAARKLAEEEAARQRAEEEARLRAEEEAERKFAEATVARQLAEAETRKREEEERRLALEEANRLAREVEAVQLRAEEARQRAETEAQQRAKEEVARKAAEEKADRLARELEEARARAEKARERVEEVASKRAEQEALLRRAEAEAARKRVEEEQASKLVQEEVQQKAEEVARKLAEVDAARKLAEEEARKLAIEEANRLQAQEEANRLAREVAAAQHDVEEAHGRAQKEAEQRTREEAARKAAEEKAERLTREVEEARRRVDEQARKHAEEEAERQHADQEARKLRAEAEAQRAAQEEAARKLAGEEAIRFAREVEAAQRRAEAAGQRAEELTRMRAEDEAARRRAEEEALRLAREVEDARRRLEEVRARAEQEALAAAQAQAAISSSQPSLRNTFPTPGSTFSEVIGVPPPRRTLPLILTLLAVIFVALPIGGYVIYRATRPSPPQPSGPESPKPKPVLADMVQIPGGKFTMGRNDAPKGVWGDAQRPAHTVTIKPFFIDRTEVTNAEYSTCVQQAGCSPPPGWSGSNPPEGQEEKWPVTNVSKDDADNFATWRSTRDGVRYRLPKEDEWEYATRGGSEDLLYPWGNNWCDDCANLGTGKGNTVDHAETVGSHPNGKDRWGVLDLIGNVWEWTSSTASFYDGSEVQSDQRGWLVIRGGSHQSLHPQDVSQRGGKEFPATFRAWRPRDNKSHTLGFCLVRDGS